MAKKLAPKEGDEVKNNIENLEALSQEFKTNKMAPRKSEMLKIRLVELWKAGSITEDEKTLAKYMLNREMKRGHLEDKYLDVLNRIEAAECEEQCQCKVDDAPTVFRVKKGQVCSFRREDQTNIKKAEKGSLFKHVVFVEEEIPPEHQMTKELLLKEERGHHASESMYPKTKTIMHRLQLDDVWFNKVFDVVEDLLSGKVKEEEYVF